MKKNSNSILMVLMLTFLLLASCSSIPAHTNQGTTSRSTDGVYLGYASIVGDGNSSILEAAAENDLRIRIDSKSELIDFFINIDMICNGLLR